MPQTIVAVGAGQAAAVAARTLRRRGFDGRIILVGDEALPPYQRPPLSKEYLTGEQEGGDLVVLGENWCAEHDVDLRLGVAAERIDTAARSVHLADGTRIRADKVLLATGAAPRRLPGVNGERTVYLRNLDDAARLRARLQPGAKLVIIGAGFIGSEVASAARAQGVDVVVLEQGETPLSRVIGSDIGAVCARIMRDAGVKLYTGEAVTAVDETASGIVVRTGGGLRVEGDALVVAVGAHPNTELAAASGLAVDNGVLVDEYCRTDVEGIYAVGDVANQHHPLFGRLLRVEHFDNASKQAMTAAKNMLGKVTAHTDPHWFWSDQFDLNLQHCGHSTDWDRIVVRGSVEDLDFTAFYLERGVVRAAFAIERGAEITAAKELVAASASPDPASLSDESVDLDSLLLNGTTQGTAIDGREPAMEG
jgi:3-phenylpropionate/trans-cinnamate dioxygenase ferredoxin reductase subunit